MSIYRYNLFKSENNKYSELYDILWSRVFDSKDPDSKWGTRVHKTIFPLTGDNVEIVPIGSKGYLMDSTCNADSWSGNAFSFTYIGNKIKVDSNDLIKASVYCYVSEDFNGSWIRIISGGKNTGITNGNDYNLLNKGTWQKLSCNISCTKTDEVDVLLYFSKSGVTDFSTLKGSVIFAYPQCEILYKKDSKLPFANLLIQESGKAMIEPVKVNILYSSSYNEAGFFPPRQFILKYSLILEDQDPIRKLAAKFINEDTVYYPYKSNIVIDTISNSFSDPRIARWAFALKIFSQEYNWKQKLFGGGFNFLNWYGYYFDKDKTRSDYPHNPFLSVLLYSGIIGLIFYLMLIYKVFYYYIKYFNEYKILSVFFIITFYFSFFSAGSPFDPPIMGFFVILPFFIHSIHKKKEPELDDDRIDQEIGSIS